MNRARSWLAIVLLGVVVSTLACGPSSESVGSKTEAVWGGSEDTSNPYRDVVVLVSPGCTGTLITPRVVLSAAHCFNSSDTPTVYFGEPSSAFTDQVDSARPVTMMISNAVAQGQTADDLAIIWLNDHVLSQAYPTRPLTGAGVSGPVWISGWSGLNGYGYVAPYAGTRQAFMFSGLPSFGQQGNDYYWNMPFTTGGTRQGDSGGPMFQIIQGGYRQVFGVASHIFFPLKTCGLCPGNIPNNGTWADVTSGDVPGWLNSHLLDTASSAMIHKPAWYARHGKNPQGMWLGEVDYIGPCRDLNQPDPAKCAALAATSEEPVDCDCDHWFDHGADVLASELHDNCPYKYNPDQADANDNGIGDECEPCPCDPDFDFDNDGFCGSCSTESAFCRGLTPQAPQPQCGRPDDCPLIHDPGQENTNVLWEDAAAFRAGHTTTEPPVWRVGDVCDPVPSPSPAPVVGDVNNAQNVQCSGVPLVCTGTVFQNVINTTTVAPHKRDALFSTPYVLKIPQTNPRFCEQGTDNCIDPQIMVDQEATFWATADAEQGNLVAHPYHRITIGSGGLIVRGEPLGPWFYGLTTNTSTWSYADDLTYWLTGPNAPKIPDCTSTGCLDGLLWLNGKTIVGDTLAYVGANFVGLHSSTPTNPDLDNGGAFIHPEKTLSWCPIPSPPIWHPDPPLRPLLKSFAWPSYGLIRPVDQLTQADTQIVITSSIDQVGAMANDGSVFALNDLPNGNGGSASCGGNQIDLTVRGIQISATGSWLSAAEASVAQGGADIVAISSDGTQVLGQATTQGLTLVSGPGPLPGADPPAPRVGFAAAYSRTLQSVFMAGGQSGTSTLHDVWINDPRGTAWNEITPSPPIHTQDLGDIEAVTYSFLDRRLWLVDEIKVGGATHARLLRAPMGGTFEVLAEWLSTGNLDQRFLNLDRDGTILVTLARSSGVGFVTGRVEITGAGAQVTASYANASTRLVAPPYISSKSYAYVVQSGTKYKILRPAAFTPRSPCALDDNL